MSAHPNDTRPSGRDETASAGDLLGAGTRVSGAGPERGGQGPAGSRTASASQPEPIRSDPSPGILRWILHAVYDLTWLSVILLGSPWVLWRCLRSPTFRRMAASRLGAGLPERPRPGARARVLVHGVSVGEVKAAQSVIAGLEARHPELEIIVSTTTDTGFEVAQKLYPEHRIVRFPIDVSFVVRRFLKRVAPCAVVLLELEVWPNFMRVANRSGLPVAVVNGRITDKSYESYQLFRRLLPQFSRISLVCVQDQEYERRFRGLGADPERMLVTGNVKVDGLKFGREDPGAELSRLLGGASEQMVFVAGSTHEPEERWVVDAWRRGAPDARLVLVPRHPGRAVEIERELAAAGCDVQLLTAMRAGEAPDPARPAIVDTIGELERVYALADMVFVGGSLIPHGGQNMLEPAAQGRPVVYGPHVRNFAQEATLLERAGASVRVEDPEGLVETLRGWCAEPRELQAMSNAGRAAVEAQKGATALTLDALEARCLAACAARGEA